MQRGSLLLTVKNCFYILQLTAPTALAVVMGLATTPPATLHLASIVIAMKVTTALPVTSPPTLVPTKTAVVTVVALLYQTSLVDLLDYVTVMTTMGCHGCPLSVLLYGAMITVIRR